METKNARFKAVVDFMILRGIISKKNDIVVKLGINRVHMYNVIAGRNVASDDYYRKICSAYELPYADWIITGHGVSPVTEKQQITKYFPNVRNIRTLQTNNYENMIFPSWLATEYALRHKDNIYLCDRYNEDFINESELFVVFTRQDSVIFRHIAPKGANQYYLYDDDESLEDIIVYKSDITDIFIVRAVMKLMI